MSTIDLDDQGRTGYFLPEDSQLRLKKLGEYVTFLANLARPRTSDENREWPVEIRLGEVAICLELLEEQIGLVLDELSWPAMLGDRPGAGEDEEPEDVEDDAEEPEAEEADDMELEAMEAGDVEPEATEDGVDNAEARYVYGATVDQIDEIDHLIRMIRAHGDVVIASHEAEFADYTLSNLGDAIFSDAERLHEIIRAVNAQRLQPPGHRRTGVREEPAAYHALSARLPMGGASLTVREHPTYQ